MPSAVIVTMWTTLVLTLLGQVFSTLAVLENQPQSDLPQPIITIVGATGVGKSSVADVLTGQPADCDECLFPVCHGANSCTKKTQYSCAPWLGIQSNKNFTVVDTPGFGDSDGQINELLAEMIKALKYNVTTTNIFLLAFNGQNPRLTSGLQIMLDQMESLFGRMFWDYAAILITKWPMDQRSQDMRKHTGHDETWLTKEMNEAIQAKSHLSRNLTAFFMDSYAKMPFNINDPVQQDAFDRETERLWNTAIASNSFEFNTIEDVLKDLDKCQTTLGNDIADLKAGLKEVEAGVKEVDIKVGDNKVYIGLLQTNTKDINVMVKNHTKSIASLDVTANSMQNAIDENTKLIQKAENAIDENTKLIQKAENDISALHIAPLGSIMAWTPRPTKDNGTYLELPDGWVRCDGSVIPSPSKWAGMKTPDLNSERRFLRGGDENSALTFEDHMLQDHYHEDNGHSHQDAGHDHKIDPSNNDQGLTAEFLLSSYGHNIYGWYSGNVLAFVTHHIQSDTAHADILPSHANIGHPSSGSHGDETRPKNMAVVWIMRVY